MHTYLDELNPQQRAAVETLNGPMMIVAGAGSGKTRVITYRIAHMINNGVDPFNILALTFTNKAAKEMRDRISSIVGPNARNIWTGTFHSIFARILRQEADKIGFPANFTIYDKDDAKSLLRSIIKEQNLDEKAYNVNHVMHRISSAKNNLILPPQIPILYVYLVATPTIIHHLHNSPRPKLCTYIPIGYLVCPSITI